MLALGHAGLTLGMAVLLAGAAIRGPSAAAAAPPRTAGLHPAPPDRVRPGPARLTERAGSWFDRLAGRVDLRILLVGSLLPDIIDKPLGHFFFRTAFSNGRILAHTMVFLILLVLAGLFLHRRAGRTWLLGLAFGTATHLVFDQIWLQPRTLWWPALGLAFERNDLTDWIPAMLHALTVNPAVYIPEAAGAAILLLLALRVLRRRGVRVFLRRGRVT
jgi:inner membrane protein